MYFTHYKKLVLLAQLDDGDVDAMAREAAQFLGLDYQRVLTGDQFLESALKVSVNFNASA